jgi:AcrR family transcriptional regulator
VSPSNKAPKEIAKARSPVIAARRTKRHDEIIDTAAALFSENGYAATGIAEIGEAVNLARGALYYYIGSKESLLVEIHNRVMDPLLREANVVVALDVDIAIRLRLLSEVLLRQILERPQHCWVFLHEYRALTGDHRIEFRKKRVVFENLITGVLVTGAEEGVFVMTDVRSTLLAFLGMHNYTYQWAHSLTLDPEVLSTIYCEIFLRGISDSPSLQLSGDAISEARQMFLDALALVDVDLAS